MTFEEAMAKSGELEAAVWLAIGLRKPIAERRAALSAYIDFNPYTVWFKDVAAAHQEPRA